MSEHQRLQFSVGPVQGFVAQSRRTRDLWASSFLLSHLAATAIKAVKAAGGKLVLPHEDALSEQDQHDFGTIPNRFVLDFVDVSTAKNAAEAGAKAVDDCWKQVAGEVRKQFVANVADTDGNDTQKIWDRQVESFWEISWVVGSVEESSTLLAARKNWRTTPATVEPGDHCTMMSDRQELSGWIRSIEVGRKRNGDENRQDKFWERLRARLDKLDLGEDERLCAIALIKRLFPKLPENIQRKLFPDRKKLLDQINWPSTAYIAAIPWLVKVADCEKLLKCAELRLKASEYADEVLHRAPNSRGERYSTIQKLNDLKNSGLTGDFLNLDGNFFQRNAIANERVTPLEKLCDGETDKQARSDLQKQLGELGKLADTQPSAFYALLLMDGDSMGELLSAARKAKPDYGERVASAALSGFSKQVPGIVSGQLGVTIYAGGDDVLAMLPLDTALQCAMQLSKAYQKAFRKTLGEDIAKRATISGAIVYAHYHTPLRDVLSTAHHLLDAVAKDATGRDSLAIAVYKSSGITAQWAAPWDHIRDIGDGAKADNIIDWLIKDLSGERSRGQTAETGAKDSRSAEFSSGFLYNVRERFAVLTDKPLTTPGQFGKLSLDLVVPRSDETKGTTKKDDDLLPSVLVADYLRGKQHQDDRNADGSKKFETERDAARRRDAKHAIERLLKLSQRVTRERVRGSDPPDFTLTQEPDTLGIDGALVVRFLACDAKEDAE